MSQLALMFGSAIATIVTQGLVKRLYDNAKGEYFKELNPQPKASGVFGYYRIGSN